MSEAHEYTGKDQYIDRELSWLGFNQRVLQEATNPEVPLLERLRFLAISSSNLDEFFEVRVSALLQKVESGTASDGIAALPPEIKLAEVLRASQKMVKEQYRLWSDVLAPLLESEGVRLKKPADCTPEECRFLDTYFRKEVYPLLTPIRVDPAHPFPWVLNKALCLAVLLKEGGRRRDGLGVLPLPRKLPRVILVPTRDKTTTLVFLQDLCIHHLPQIFQGHDLRGHSCFRATRNSNLYLDEEEGDNLLDAVEAVVHNRRRGNVVRLEIQKGGPKRIVDELVKYFDLAPSLIFEVGHPVNFIRLREIPSLVPRPDLKFAPAPMAHLPRFSEAEDIFRELRSNDVLLHHPFDSYDPVVKFIETVANDPDVLAIKLTLYRTNRESPIMYALMEAAEMGKEVVVVVELKARFDEASNIQWARQLEERGGTVLYGLVGLKTHCKLALVTRREGQGFRQYAHLGTGNYNPETARLYTDFSMLTSDRGVVDGVAEVFHYLTARNLPPDFRSLRVGPSQFLAEILSLIRRERDLAREGRPCGIMAKMNALFDAEVIDALYEASQAGVPVRLIVRGICALRPGVAGLSDRIEVRSVVGRFLEHSRIFRFENGGKPDLYLSSGDWMQRNLRERVEVMWPVAHPELRRRVEEVLSVYWADNVNARHFLPDGQTEQRLPEDPQDRFCAQVWFLKRAEGVEPAPPPSLFEAGNSGQAAASAQPEPRPEAPQPA